MINRKPYSWGWLYKYSSLNKRVIAFLHSEYVSTAEERKERDE